MPIGIPIPRLKPKARVKKKKSVKIKGHKKVRTLRVRMIWVFKGIIAPT